MWRGRPRPRTRAGAPAPHLLGVSDRMRARASRRDSSPWLMTLPWVLTLLVFWVYPLCYALALGFAKYDIFSRSWQWVGFANFRAVLTNADFWSALGHTGVFTLGPLPATTGLA